MELHLANTYGALVLGVIAFLAMTAGLGGGPEGAPPCKRLLAFGGVCLLGVYLILRLNP